MEFGEVWTGRVVGVSPGQEEHPVWAEAFLSWGKTPS